jgi:hypothetical protein
MFEDPLAKKATFPEGMRHPPWNEPPHGTLVKAPLKGFRTTAFADV